MGKIRTKVIETAIEPEKLEKIEELELEKEAKPEEEVVVKATKKKQREGKAKQRGRRYKNLASTIDKSKLYPAEEALELIQKAANTKFDETIEAHINLGISPDKQEHQVRTSVVLPHQVGKKIKILVFAEKGLEELKKFGAEIGNDETLKEIEAGKVGFDKIVADPSWMPKLAKVAKVLGPKGLMPNPKSGTVTDNPMAVLKEFAQGKVELRAEKAPIIHVVVGKRSFETKKLAENLASIITALRAAKPEGFKKELIKSVYLSSTMGPSLRSDPSSLQPTEK
jgi:large subunit ribosomal protein L1